MRAAVPLLEPLGDRAGGCSSACSEMHTFTWPCASSMWPVQRAWWQRPAAWLRRRLCVMCWRWAGRNLLCRHHRRVHRRMRA